MMKHEVNQTVTTNVDAIILSVLYEIITVIRRKDHLWIPELFFIEIIRILLSISIELETDKYISIDVISAYHQPCETGLGDVPI